MTPKKTKEEAVGEFRCAGIEDAAIAVIARKGIDQATIQEIAREAGIAKGTVYLYYSDREELLAKTANRSFERFLAAIEPAFAEEASFPERLHRVVLGQLRFFDENADLLRAAMALSHRENELHGKPKAGAHGRYLHLLEGMFTTAKKRGELRDLDPSAVAAIYRDCVRGVLIRRLERKSRTRRMSCEQEAELIVSILLRGIQTDKKRSGRNE